MANPQAVNFLTGLAKAAFSLGLGATAVNSSLYTLDETVGEGTHFLIPWLQTPYIFDIRTKPHTFSSVSGTKDLQMVNLTLRLLSHPEVPSLPSIFKTLGTEYDEKVLPSIDQLLTERPHVSALVRESLIKRAKDFNIVLDDVAITHLSYGAEFSKAVEQNKLLNKKLRDLTAAGMGLIELRRIEASREIASTLARSPNVSYLPGGNNILLGLNPGRLFDSKTSDGAILRTA
ncbi:hypothetical protein MKW98_027862 [Papaver atlanticum]|uniref:Prohibitin n=1 Tax=Papaver atlanticum TaxID=357466 RepID=A0AAD4XFZ1_9MAGN|nr:hypothetical protein MKW98_027862 [Papaver atlanticum]